MALWWLFVSVRTAGDFCSFNIEFIPIHKKSECAKVLKNLWNMEAVAHLSWFSFIEFIVVFSFKKKLFELLRWLSDRQEFYCDSLLSIFSYLFFWYQFSNCGSKDYKGKFVQGNFLFFLVCRDDAELIGNINYAYYVSFYIRFLRKERKKHDDLL